MSYVAVPHGRALRRSLYGLGDAYLNFPSDTAPPPSASTVAGQAQSYGDSAKASAVAFANAQLASYPTAATVAETYDEYSQYLKSIPGFNPSDLQDPSKVEALMKQALINYAVASGYPVTTAALEQQLYSYAASVASSELGVDLPPNWPSNVKDLKSAAVDLAVTAVVMYTGVDPKILTVTYDCLKDGTLSEGDCEAIGATAGAIAGAVIGQAVGIPAPIGAFIGGLVGKDIGGTFAEIFSIRDADTRLADMQKMENSMLAQGQALCDAARSQYWMTFDKLIMATELQWRTAEVSVGWKFGLRWFGTEPGGSWSFSHAYNPTSGRFDGAVTTANRAVQVGPGQASVIYDDSDNAIRFTSYTYACATDSGCPYPIVPNIPAPAGFERDVQAFFARGAEWIAPSTRSYSCSLPTPPVATNAGPIVDNFLAAINQDIVNEQTALTALNTISVLVIGDLVKTVACNTAEAKLNSMLRAPADTLNAAQVMRGQNLAKAKITGANLSDLLNYGTLALGAGLLGAVLYKRYYR